MTGERCSHQMYDIEGEKYFCPVCFQYYEYTPAEKAAVERQVFERVMRELGSPGPIYDKKSIWLLYKYATKYKRIVEEESK